MTLARIVFLVVVVGMVVAVVALRRRREVRVDAVAVPDTFWVP